MFLTGIKTEPIPERILSICQAVEDRGPISRKDLEKLLVPEKLNTAKTSYFGPVFDAATELKLIGTNEHDQIIFIIHPHLLTKHFNYLIVDSLMIIHFYPETQFT